MNEDNVRRICSCSTQFLISHFPPPPFDSPTPPFLLSPTPLLLYSALLPFPYSHISLFPCFLTSLLPYFLSSPFSEAPILAINYICTNLVDYGVCGMHMTKWYWSLILLPSQEVLINQGIFQWCTERLIFEIRGTYLMLEKSLLFRMNGKPRIINASIQHHGRIPFGLIPLWCKARILTSNVQKITSWSPYHSGPAWFHRQTHRSHPNRGLHQLQHPPYPHWLSSYPWITEPPWPP